MVYNPSPSAYAKFMEAPPCVAVVGMGYVGLPLATALARHFTVLAFDTNTELIENLQQSHLPFLLTCHVEQLKTATVFIVAVPTPVAGDSHTPDLQFLESACASIAPIIKKDDIICFESTVYPKTLDDVCTPVLEKFSSLTRQQDFFLAYAPERISPGSHDYTLEKLPRVVAADNEQSLKIMSFVYGSINQHNITVAPSIVVAEAAKLLENVQRDVNIALANEMTVFCDRLGISARDVITTASSKPNFYTCYPGLVGGHCIGVDPYYLLFKAQELYTPQSITHNARVVNENMALHFAQMIHARIVPCSRVLVYGIAFKANVDDIRNSKVPQLVQHLCKLGHAVDVVDPVVDKDSVSKSYNIQLSSLTEFENTDYDALVIAVGHRAAQHFPFERCLKKDALIADLHAVLPAPPKHFHYWKP